MNLEIREIEPGQGSSVIKQSEEVEWGGAPSLCVETEDPQVHRARLEPGRWSWRRREQDAGSEQELVPHSSPEKGLSYGEGGQCPATGLAEQVPTLTTCACPGSGRFNFSL